MSARPELTPAPQTIPAIGDLVNGKYRVDGTAGTGGMGVVLSATHVELGHRVAIKLLASEEETNSTAIERFLREGKAAASLQSDHVVRIYDVGRLASGNPFMVMELLRGQDLGTVIGSTGSIEMVQAVDWILQACNAIAEAHANGIVHRDLKPSNLFLTRRSDGSDCIKVLDFGISKRLTSADAEVFQGALTATRQVVGSPAYMSPEQVRNSRDIDHRVDIWALGMTLYEFLSGRPAFNADTFPAVCAAIVADPPPPLREVVENVPEALDRIVLRCLEKDPARRFASVTELASALQPFGTPRTVATAQSLQQSSFKSEARSGSIDPSTLASARSPGNRQSSQPRSRDNVDLVFGARTLQSSQHDDPMASSARQGLVWRSRSRRNVWLLLGAVGFAAGVGWKVRTSTPKKDTEQPGAQAPIATAVHSTHFAVRFESEPSGASVWEGGKLLGATPFSHAMDRSSVLSGPKEFVVRAAGYTPFTATQGDSDQDVLIVARLSPSPAPTPPSSPAPAVIKTGPKPLQSGATSPIKQGVHPRVETAPIPNDIRPTR